MAAVPSLPVLVAAAIAAATLAGLWAPPWAALVGAAAGAVAGVVAVAAYARAGRCGSLLAAGLVGAASLALARAATAFAAAADPSIVAALEGAGVLAEDAPRPRPLGRLDRHASPRTPSWTGPRCMLRLAVSRAGHRAVRLSDAGARRRPRRRGRRHGAGAAPASGGPAAAST